VAARAVVERAIVPGKEIALPFELHGSGEHESLQMATQLVSGRVFLELPVRALPWRDLAWRQANNGPLQPWKNPEARDAVPSTRVALDRRKTHLVTGIEGAKSLHVGEGIATIEFFGDERNGKLVIPELRLAPNSKPLPIVLRVEGARINERNHAVHLMQISRGRGMGGLTLDLSESLR
jgi:hypothetical protein